MISTNLLRNLLATIIAGAALLSLNAHAAPVLQIENSVLTGAKGIAINGKIYDVEFLAGSCTTVFSPCQDSAFHFTDGASAGAAARALAEQVFPLSTEWFPSTFPGTTRGCGSTRDCWIFTPYSSSGGGVSVATFHNALHMPDTLAFDVVGIEAEYSDVGFARWSEAATMVPEPGSIALLSIALAGIGFVRRIR